MKRITLCALLMTLFLLSSCNTSGNATKDGQAAKSDGTLIDLVTITKNIKDSVDFAKDVKDVHTLVKSIDELAKAIGKKIKDDGTLENEVGKNGSLIAGVHSVVSAVKTRLEKLEKQNGVSNEVKTKITEVKNKAETFLGKLKDNHNDLGKNEVGDDDAQKAIDRTNQPNGDKGAKELGELNTAVDALLTSAEAAVTAAISALTTPFKPFNT
ncbi:Vsp/OspC family lipoprotein [Borrelia puertoricensis]|uniref:Vsp/OspC family lipoprotein n=1 Tax=Borrelia puertoricensis TaxID=2756107 RepID=UPI00322196E7